ncbi:4572_t:CDS:2 [Funneliformis mosseae]|nr:4572_t:CDS:2 [Funneliformis mosseae]
MAACYYSKIEMLHEDQRKKRNKNIIAEIIIPMRQSIQIISTRAELGKLEPVLHLFMMK